MKIKKLLFFHTCFKNPAKIASDIKIVPQNIYSQTHLRIEMNTAVISCLVDESLSKIRNSHLNVILN